MLLHARTLFLCLMILVCALTSVSAQTADSKNDNVTLKPSYEITLQLLVSSDTATGKLPANLAPVEKKLKTDFGQANYQVAMTLLNRVAERGYLETKGVSPFVQNQAGDKSFNFYGLNLNGIKSNDGEMLIESLRFDLQIPLYIPTTASEGKTVVNYQNLGITAKPLSLSFNEPTVIGTLTTSRPNELIVLVLTVDEIKSNRAVAKKSNN